MIKMHNGEKVEILINAEEIQARVKEVAAEIAADIGDEPITLLGTLKGAIFFLTDLARHLGSNVEIDFIKASSYGNRTKSDGVVQLEHFPGTVLAGRNIIIVEDIVDSGYTVKYLREYIQKEGPASIKICSLLDKPDRREVAAVKCDYLGFTVPDKFLVGYGLDYSQRYRNLPYIGVLHLPM